MTTKNWVMRIVAGKRLEDMTSTELEVVRKNKRIGLTKPDVQYIEHLLARNWAHAKEI